MASGPGELSSFHAVLRDLDAWLKETRVEGVVIGGVAVAFLGRPRVTRDVDVLIWTDDGTLGDFLAAGVRWGFSPRISDPLDFAAQSRVLLLEHTPSGITADVALGGLEFERELIASSQSIAMPGFEVRLPRAEDLILMKAVAQRDRDLIDIGSVVANQPNLDRKYIRRRAKELATLLDQPDLVKVINRYLKPKKR